jgi:shikimate dehydrogenase
MRKYGLVGKKLDHSFSKSFFTEYFEKHEIDASYENIEVPTIASLLDFPGLETFSGFNVTIPYKTAIIPLLHGLSPEAEAIGAVNTVKIAGGKMTGYNTDAFGFQQSIKPFLTNLHERALILGTGGASKAVEYVLHQIGLDVLFVSRDPQANEFSYGDINENMVNACKLIVNCTPVGTFPDVTAKPDFPTQFLTPQHLVADLIYNPAKTQLLQEAEARGADILNGHSMLKEQAMKAWEIWNKAE